MVPGSEAYLLKISLTSLGGSAASILKILLNKKQHLTACIAFGLCYRKIAGMVMEFQLVSHEDL